MITIKSVYNRVTSKIKCMLYDLYLQNCRQRNKNTNATIISQNCVGGVIYHKLNMRFNSPTINMFIEDENFVKLIENLEHYMSCDAFPITDCYIDPIDTNINYPKIGVDDIELCCLHYKDCQEAIQKWEERKKRVNFDNVFVIGNTWNLHGNEDYIKRICNCRYPSIVLAHKEYEWKNCIKMNGDFHLDERGILRPDVFTKKPHSYKSYIESQFDFVSFLNP